jgi:uncharacterized membrane protein (GlpM family)
MKVAIDLAPLRQARWSGHLVRFLIGGAVTVATGVIAEKAGAVVGGLFLAFPAIFPVGLATIEKLHNQQAGPAARGHRARRAAIAESVGAIFASFGLIGFALSSWLLLRVSSLATALSGAVVAWILVAVSAWVTNRILRGSWKLSARR